MRAPSGLCSVLLPPLPSCPARRLPGCTGLSLGEREGLFHHHRTTLALCPCQVGVGLQTHPRDPAAPVGSPPGHVVRAQASSAAAGTQPCPARLTNVRSTAKPQRSGHHWSCGQSPRPPLERAEAGQVGHLTPS